MPKANSIIHFDSADVITQLVLQWLKLNTGMDDLDVVNVGFVPRDYGEPSKLEVFVHTDDIDKLREAVQDEFTIVESLERKDGR